MATNVTLSNQTPDTLSLVASADLHNPPHSIAPNESARIEYTQGTKGIATYASTHGEVLVALGSGEQGNKMRGLGEYLVQCDPWRDGGNLFVVTRQA